MTFLNRVPFWAWFLLMLVLCYGIGNPWGISLYAMLVRGENIDISVKFLVSIIVLAILIPTFIQTTRSLGWLGMLIFFLLLGGSLWVLTTVIDVPILVYTAPYWIQIPTALLLTLGLRWSKYYSSITGSRNMNDGDGGGQAEGHP